MSPKIQNSTEETSAEVLGAGKMVELPTNDEEFTMEVRKASPAHFLMKIESFSLLSKQCESPEFETGGYKWRLVIHPNRPINSQNDEADHISAYLAMVETSSMPVGWEVNATFSIFLYNQVSDHYLCFQSKMRRFHAMKFKWGFSKLISMKNFRDPAIGFLVDDNCVIGAEVAVIQTERVTQCVSVKKFDIPYKHEWKISSFSKLGKVWHSEEFTFGDHKWYIMLYPNGDTSVEGQSVSMYLFLVGAESFISSKKVKADFYLRIKNQLNDQHHSLHKSLWFTSSVHSSGWDAFVPLSDMRDSKKGFVVNDCCIVEVEISSTDTMGVQENRKWPSCFGKTRAPGNGFLVDDNRIFGAEAAVTKTPHVLEWKISSYSKLGEVWSSEKFTVGDHKWCLKLYPNGFADQVGRSVSIFLFLDGAESLSSHERVKADFHLRIMNHRNHTRSSSVHACHCFTSSSDNWGCVKFIPLSIMRNPNQGFVVEDCCIVQVERQPKGTAYWFILFFIFFFFLFISVVRF